MDFNEENIAQKVKELLSGQNITPATRKALEDRIAKSKNKNRFFSDDSFQLLSVICDRLFDQESDNRMVNAAVFIDDRLAENKHDGWRYNDMPPDDIAYLKGLKGINETAQSIYGKDFLYLEKEGQIKILELIQQGKAKGAIWDEMPAERFFEELLAEATEIFFSYPSVQIQMNYTGMADAAGWQKIGLNESDNTNEAGNLS